MTVAEFYAWAPPEDPDSDPPLWELVDGVPVSRVGLTGQLHGVTCAFTGHVLWRGFVAARRGYAAAMQCGLLVSRDRTPCSPPT